ncbi:hypothetical protein N9P58_03635, partial [Puniceicoccaceae bacterium]|nr:hypothetical protein [Puniceicoccaceae bacterium]
MNRPPSFETSLKSGGANVRFLATLSQQLQAMLPGHQFYGKVFARPASRHTQRRRRIWWNRDL